MSRPDPKDSRLISKCTPQGHRAGTAVISALRVLQVSYWEKGSHGMQTQVPELGVRYRGKRDWKSQVEIAKIEKNFGPEESNAVPGSCTQLQYDPETGAGTEGDAVRSRRPSERLPEEEIDPEFRTRRFMGRTVARGEAERKPRERPGAAAGSRGAQDSTLRLRTLLGVRTSSFCSLRLRARNAGTSPSSRPFQKRIGLCGFLCSLRPSHKVK